MIEQGLEYLETAGHAISLFAVLVIVVGFVRAAVHYAQRFDNTARADNFKQSKIELGSALLLALEILVLADVIETITTPPTPTSLAFLGAIIMIRTAMSWTLTLEIEGHWPWRVAAVEGSPDE